MVMEFLTKRSVQACDRRFGGLDPSEAYHKWPMADAGNENLSEIVVC